MASETTGYIVKVLCNGRMLRDGQDEYPTRSQAVARAEACAEMGEYAEVREIVRSEKLIQRFEPAQ